MRDELRTAACVLANPYVRQWKEDGRPVVGYTCSYVPDEVFHAVGILPYRIRGFGASETTIGDTYFGPFVCSLPKCMLQLAGQGDFAFLDGVLITPGCDSMRRLDECWRKAGEDHPGTLPGFFFHFGVPHKYTDYTVKWFTEEIERLIEALQAHFKVTITRENLSRSVTVYNKGRALLEELEALRAGEAPPLSGADALAAVLAGSTLPREVYNELLADTLEDAGRSGVAIRGRKRLMLVGSADDDVDLVRLVEGDKAIVVADNLCFGGRFHADRVAEDIQPVEALARRYLRKNECPRMYGDYKARLQSLKDKIRRARVQGVVLQNIRFCDLHGSENGLFERDLEAMGIPCLRLEREYGPIVESARVRMRVDALLERIDQRGVPV